MNALATWAWVFMAAYVAVMMYLGRRGQQQTGSSDDYAVARGAYSPVILAVAYAATTASGATFLGLPGLSYRFGLSTMWVGFLYPIGIYIGVLMCQRMVTQFGNRLGHRSLPEFLGDRYQSDAVRVVASVFSLILMFYIAGQLIGGLVMFEVLLGLDRLPALLLTGLVLCAYVVMGGAHADIMTDFVQGALMLAIAVLVGVMFVTGYGAGGLDSVLTRLGELDPHALKAFNPEFPLADHWWDLVAMVLAFIPLGLLPHLANKLWAIDDPTQRGRFIATAMLCGVGFQLLVLGGLLARAVLGDALFADGITPNAAIPMLFIELFSPWIAALLGTAILAAVMSTVDGLVISTAQVFANDIYRRTLVPRLYANLSEDHIERNVLAISRWGTALTMVAATVLAWFLFDINIVLVTWIGIGGFVAALAGSLVLGVFWRGVTKAGALWGFIAGAGVFIIVHSGAIPHGLLSGLGLGALADWLLSQASNPYACSALGEVIAVAVTVVVSWFTPKLPAAHIQRVFGD